MKLSDKKLEIDLLTYLFEYKNFMLDVEIFPEYFSDENHKKIYETLWNIYQNDEPWTRNFVSAKLQNNKAINEILLKTSADSPLPTRDIKRYVEELRDLSIKRRLRDLAYDINNKALTQGENAKSIIELVESEVYKISLNADNNDAIHIQESMKEVIQNIIDKKEHRDLMFGGVDSGFNGLDIKTTGFQPGDLVIIAARPGMGKTSLAINITNNVISSGKTVIFFSLEMPAKQIAMRTLSVATKIPLQEMKSANIEEFKIEKLAKISDEYASHQLYIDDSSFQNINTIRSKVRKFKTKHKKLSLVIIDYLQIMSGTGHKDRHLEIAEISRGLKSLARELEIPIIALSQLNRLLETRDDKRPMLSDLRESGAIEQDADIILFLYRGEVYKKAEMHGKLEKAKGDQKATLSDQIMSMEHKDREEVELIIGKHRNGPTGTIKISLIPSLTSFEDIGQKELMDRDLPIDRAIDYDYGHDNNEPF